MSYPWSVTPAGNTGTDTGWPFAGMVIRDRLKCCQRVSGAFFRDNGWFGGTGNALQSDLAENTGTR